MIFLIFSKSLLPPGSLVNVDLILFFIKYFFNNLIWVDLPEYSKPSKLIAYLINFISSKNSIVLDFFAGSSTTAHAVMQLNAEDGSNRKFIMVQSSEECNPKSEAVKAGFSNIAEISKVLW